MVKIGTIELEKTAALAPMAGVTDRAFRELCREFGAAFTVGEMTSAKGITYASKKSAELLEIGPGERPTAAQLFGNEPETVAEAARFALRYQPDWIDLNMGCPAPKIAGNGGGCALMKDPELAGRIIRAVTRAVDLPVTVKFRKGWDEDSVNAVQFAKIAEENGAAALTVHGRTRKQMYAPPVDREIIRQVKEAVRIPVIGNGDIVDVPSAIQMYEETGCDMVMIGRGALGAPWVFRQIQTYFATGTIPAEPPLEEKMAILLRQIDLSCRYKGERIAVREARKHLGWYLKGIRGAAGFRNRASGVCTQDDCKALVEEVLEHNREPAEGM